MAPLAKVGEWAPQLGLVAGFLIGIGFGWALEMGGLGNSRKLAAQFYFKDLTVFKVMFTAIIVAELMMLGAGALGIMDLSLVFLNPTFMVPMVIGGLVMGVGFIAGGW